MQRATQQEVREEMERRKSRRQSMLATLKEQGELTTKDMMQFGPGLSSRLHELRKEGHKILCVHDSGNHYRYVYLGLNEDYEDDSKVTVVD